MGGVILLLMITVMLCIVILCMRRCHQKALSYKLMSKNVTYHSNPLYDVKAKAVDSLYNTIKPGDSDVPITSNPSYNVPTLPYSEDELYNYIQPNEFNQHSDTIKMHTNPSYRHGLTVGEDRATAFSTTAADTKASHSSHDATTEEYDYAYAQDDHLLHHNTTADTTDDTKITRSPYLTLVSNDAKAHNGSAAK